jgi:ketosteroid isomerase-like protein
MAVGERKMKVPAAPSANDGAASAGSSHLRRMPMATTAQHANIQRSKRAYEAFGKGDMATVSDLLADDVLWHVGGSSPLSGDYKGKDAVFGFFGKLMEVTGGTFKLEVHDILANDDHSVTLVRTTAEKNGKKLDSRAVHVTHPDSEGRVKEFWAFDEDQAAADKFFSS